VTPANRKPGGVQPGGDPYSPLGHWSLASAVWDIRLAAVASREEITTRSARRFAEFVQFARERSPYYAELYRSLPQSDIQPRQVPPVTRGSLRDRFDDWVTDPDVTYEAASAFVTDPERIGQPYLGRYAVWTSSGTTGEPGLFVHDGQALAVYDALEMLRLGRGLLAPGFLGSLLFAGGRYAMVAATGGHFAGAASVERMRLLAPALADLLRVFSILEPLPRLIEALNDYQPLFVATYPTVASLLAEEQRGGRLGIRPAAMWLGGETLSAACRAELVATFRSRNSPARTGSRSCRSGRTPSGFVSMHPPGADRPALWLKVERALRAYLDVQGLPRVVICLDAAPLERSCRSGKLRRVVALRSEARGELTVSAAPEDPTTTFVVKEL